MAELNNTKDGDSNEIAPRKSDKMNGTEKPQQTLENKFSEKDIPCSPGQLILGRDSNAVKCYTTRYRVNRNYKRNGTCMDAIYRTILPCASAENTSSCVDFITAFLKSEAFLMFLHVAALGFGVTKEVYNMREVNDKLHFVMTVFEKVLCIAGILLRVFAVYNEYKDVNEALARMESSENDNAIYSKSIGLWSLIFTLLSSLTIFLVVAAFVLLHLYEQHLGWTIITTNCSLLFILTFHHILKSRNDLALYRLTLDHHKIILEESFMFLKEGLCFKGWVNQDFILRCRDYVLAYDVTREFRRQEYIDVCEEDQLCVSLNISTV